MTCPCCKSDLTNSKYKTISEIYHDVNCRKCEYHERHHKGELVTVRIPFDDKIFITCRLRPEYCVAYVYGMLPNNNTTICMHDKFIMPKTLDASGARGVYSKIQKLKNFI